MFNLEEEIKAWKYLLDTGEIDELTYNKEINKLKLKAEKRKRYKNNSTYAPIKISLKTLIFYLIFFIILIIIFKENYIKKNIEYVNSLRNLPEPTQIRTSGNTTKIIYGTDVQINYIAKYSISGRVVDVQNYYGYNIENKLSPKDIGMSWGFFANEENHKKVTWTSLGNRSLSWYSNDGNWISKMGGVSKISQFCSNNHLIPSDNKIKRLIDEIKEGDFIRIEGRLVKVNYRINSSNYVTWNTSTSRTDSGDGACEVIYVTDVTWLKEK